MLPSSDWHVAGMMSHRFELSRDRSSTSIDSVQQSTAVQASIRSLRAADTDSDIPRATIWLLSCSALSQLAGFRASKEKHYHSVDDIPDELHRSMVDNRRVD